jgi:serine phosphatase RsbU (regulator of sigma subunit)
MADTWLINGPLRSVRFGPERTGYELAHMRNRLRDSERTVDAQRRALAEQHEINGRLQQAILQTPEPVTDLNGMRVAVRYLGADGPVQVGGDWHLLTPLPDGDLLLAVGDVAGHGLDAAATMVALRHAMTAFAVQRRGPSAILTALNTLLCQQMTGTVATAVVARYRPATRKLTWARAGHLPILLADRDGVGPLRQPPGPILGAFAEAVYGHATTGLREGDLLLMYTDGFVEGRGGSLDEGVETLGEQVRGAMGVRRDDRPGALVGRLRRRNPDDDACALAAEPLP